MAKDNIRQELYMYSLHRNELFKDWRETSFADCDKYSPDFGSFSDALGYIKEIHDSRRAKRTPVDAVDAYNLAVFGLQNSGVDMNGPVQSAVRNVAKLLIEHYAGEVVTYNADVRAGIDYLFDSYKQNRLQPIQIRINYKGTSGLEIFVHKK